MPIMKTLTINGETFNVVPVVPAASITLLASAWVSDGDAHSQVVNIPGITPCTKVDLLPTAAQLAEFHHKVLAFVAENEGGKVTVYAIGDRPQNDHTIQITTTEVDGADVIRGNTVGTTMPRPDWNQTDPTKADFIKNKPSALDGKDGKDGVSATHSWNGTVLTITSASGTSSEDLKGEKGEPGEKGADGASGKAGKDGVSPSVAVDTILGGHRVTITDANGTQSFDVMDGEAGSGGASGEYLPREGGTMQGDIDMNGYCIYFGSSDGDRPYITGGRDADGVPSLEILGMDNDDCIRIHSIADPVGDLDVANKRYVDTFAADYIVDQSTSGIWTYRKWNSGKIELWTNSYQFTISFTTSSNGFSYATESDIPVPLVKSIEFASGDCTKWHYTNWASVTCKDEQKLGIRYYGLNGNGNGNTIPFSFYVIGTWK